ncbi:hypothetical protein FUAX_23400 [Fulvitalea axinellae]|uniref:Glycosyl hydrolases family 43 n=1 Tax=Fulvitalea axinellae TaxID=1182444 RepID=A0AAU9D1U8_9BACT|nr:hypothetical protein FUAX_23400 [Fulvitalea axinellae]
MRYLFSIPFLIFLTDCSFSQNKKSQTNSHIRSSAFKPETFSDNWKYVGEAINEPGYDIWGGSPIRDEKGNVHIFCARWKADIPFEKAWRYDSEIAHYVAKKPEGPFRFVEVVASPSTTGKGWKTSGFHNPNIRKVGDKYVLVFIANDGAKTHGPTQFIGMMVAESLNGPWRSIPDDNNPILKTSEDKDVWCFDSGCGVTNPSLIAHPDGRFLLYFKAMTGPRPKGKVSMGVAEAKKLEGPYIIRNKPITSNEKMIEDGYAFVWKNRVCLLTTDNHGILEHGGGVLWASDDGYSFSSKVHSGFHHFGKYYLKGNIPESAKAHYNKDPKFERPQILFDQDKEPEYLYCPSGVAIDGSDGTNSYVLKYNNIKLQ